MVWAHANTHVRRCHQWPAGIGCHRWCWGSLWLGEVVVVLSVWICLYPYISSPAGYIQFSGRGMSSRHTGSEILTLRSRSIHLRWRVFSDVLYINLFPFASKIFQGNLKLVCLEDALLLPLGVKEHKRDKRASSITRHRCSTTQAQQCSAFSSSATVGCTLNAPAKRSTGITAGHPRFLELSWFS